VASFAFPSNSPISGGVRITYHGFNFAQDRPSLELISMQQCWDLQWTVGPTDPGQSELMPVLLCRNSVDARVLGYRTGLAPPADPYASLQALTVSTQVSHSTACPAPCGRSHLRRDPCGRSHCRSRSTDPARPFP
jgi:hypothetical protein